MIETEQVDGSRIKEPAMNVSRQHKGIVYHRTLGNKRPKQKGWWYPYIAFPKYIAQIYID